MNLVIDIGNTRSKVAVFDSGQIIFTGAYPEITQTSIEEITKPYTKIENAIVSATGYIPDYLIPWFKSKFKFFLTMHAQLKLPFTIEYRTPHTLGNDRIAAVAAANAQFPGQNCLVIDAGTAITFDLIDSQNVYRGGNISPGLSMRFQALHTFTQKLPLIEQSGETPLLGYSTETAIRSGVIWGVVFEIERYINELKGMYPNLQIMLTGGDSVFLADKINYPIFVDEFLVLKGLNRILEYNAQV